MFRQKWLIAILFVCAAVFISSCGSASEEAGKPTSSTEDVISNKPVTLKLFQTSAALTDEEFEDFIVQPVKKKHPNISLEIVRDGKGSTLADLVAAGTPPDIIYTSQNKLQDVIDLNLQYDLNEMIKKSKLDLGRFEPVTIEGIKKYSKKDELYGLPFSINSSALFYNKDLFDKFGVPYPKDKMIWDQVIELGKRMARQDGGVQYKALFPSSLTQLAQQFSAPYTDPKTDASLLNTDPWIKAATLYKKIYEIPGNEDAVLADFFGKRVLAMYAGVANNTIGEVQNALSKGEPLNWDMVSYPNSKETVGKSMALAAQVVMIASTSQNKDQAFQVLSLVTDTENQANMSRHGRLPSLKDKATKEQFGLEIPALKGKNLQAFFLNTSPIPNYERYGTLLGPIISKESEKLKNGNVDVNTFLRNLNDLAQQAVNEDKAGRGEK